MSDAETLNHTTCTIREVRWDQPSLPCDRCQQPAHRIGTATRTAIDVDLDAPVLLAVTISVHRCAACCHTFRAQPPFLRPDAIYSNRVVTAAVRAVFQDGMAVRRVATRLARDFWVRPSEGMIRRWCKEYSASLDFATDYLPWVVGEFSGILCVDEVYQGQLAVLLAVDPAAPEGDRLVGYQLFRGSVDQEEVATFLAGLRAAGIDPAEVITDGGPGLADGGAPALPVPRGAAGDERGRPDHQGRACGHPGPADPAGGRAARAAAGLPARPGGAGPSRPGLAAATGSTGGETDPGPPTAPTGALLPPDRPAARHQPDNGVQVAPGSTACGGPGDRSDAHRGGGAGR